MSNADQNSRTLGHGMKPYFQYFFSFCFFALLGQTSQAQADSLRRHRVAVFAPLYLDSAFDASGNYRYGTSFPKFISPGLEFYEGARLALDTLESQKVALEVHFYDTRSTSQTLAQILESPDFTYTELIIGQVNLSEMRDLARTAAHLNVPFINVSFPNDGGITNNPDFVILNSTLLTHCEGIYRFLQRNYPLADIVVFRKRGAQEDRLQSYFEEIGKNTASVPLKLTFIGLEEPVSLGALTPHLDSSKKTICVVASMDENFGKSICAQLASVNKTYVTKIFGMPTWDNIDAFSQPEFEDQEIYYTTPFYANPNDSLVSFIQQYFKTRFYSRPSDMVFRGYETMYHFSRLLELHGHDLGSYISERKFSPFNDFDIQPIFLNKHDMTLDYFENKKLFFIKKVNGNIVAVY
jgi:hypothetical protein